MSEYTTPEIQVVKRYGTDGDAMLALYDCITPKREALLGGKRNALVSRDRKELAPYLANALASVLTPRRSVT